MSQDGLRKNARNEVPVYMRFSDLPQSEAKGHNLMTGKTLGIGESNEFI